MQYDDRARSDAFAGIGDVPEHLEHSQPPEEGVGRGRPHAVGRAKQNDSPSGAPDLRRSRPPDLVAEAGRVESVEVGMRPRVVADRADLRGRAQCAPPVAEPLADEKERAAGVEAAQLADDLPRVPARPVVERQRHELFPPAAAIDGDARAREPLDGDLAGAAALRGFDLHGGCRAAGQQEDCGQHECLAHASILHIVSAIESPARHTIAVAGGKGGVGKSTVTLNLARAFAQRGASVGLLDADLYGPDIPAMLGLARTRDAERWTVWSKKGASLVPLERHGLKIMSAGFLLGDRQVMPWASQTLPFVLRQLIHDVQWGDLDYLFIDLPPGTADLQAEVFRAVPLTGALLVVGPQDVAHLDAKKVITLLRDADVRVLGAVENMSGLVCPHCGELLEVFPPVTAERSIWQDGIERLASIPLDPTVARMNGVPAAFAELAATLELLLA
jgi:ATP-binding protein involved in chromosome partitioning